MKNINSILNEMLDGIDKVVKILNETSSRVDWSLYLFFLNIILYSNKFPYIDFYAKKS